MAFCPVLSKITDHFQEYAIMKSFLLCDLGDSKCLGECGDQVKARCNFLQIKTWIYQVGCKIQFTGEVGFDCPVPAHMYSFLQCCSYYS